MKNKIPKIYCNWITRGNSFVQVVPFLNWKSDLQKDELSKCEKIRSRNLLVEVDNKKYTENLIEMKTFNNLKWKVYPYGKLNISKGVIRNRELSLATPEEIQP